MEITTDISLKGTAWNNAIEKLEPLFPRNFQKKQRPSNYMLYILALSVGIMYDKRIEKPEENGEEIKNVPRNVLQNNDNGRLDFMFQAAILTTNTENLSEEERLELAFGDKIEYNKIAFLTSFANFGITKIVEQIGLTSIDTMENLKNFFENIFQGQNWDIEGLPDELLLDEFEVY